LDQHDKIRQSFLSVSIGRFLHPDLHVPADRSLVDNLAAVVIDDLVDPLELVALDDEGEALPGVDDAKT